MHGANVVPSNLHLALPCFYVSPSHSDLGISFSFFYAPFYIFRLDAFPVSMLPIACSILLICLTFSYAFRCFCACSL